MYEKLKQRVLPELIPLKSKILVAVSGGPDSVALAHILKRFAQDELWRDLSLVMTHVNHGVRQESEQEEEMVRELGKSWGIPCIVHRFDAKDYAKQTGKSFQESAREWRYARWEEDRLKWHCSLLATAHHLGDQAETVLYRLIRGSGTSGLAGIYPKQREIIRPLLGITKEEILEYCQNGHLDYALDQSNEETLYVRNKIRLELIPELKNNYNYRIIQALGRTAEILRWDEEYLDSQAENNWPQYLKHFDEYEVVLDRRVFQEPKAILSRMLRKAIRMVNHEPRGIGFEFIERIMAAQAKLNWVQDVPGVRVSIEQEGIRFRHPLIRHPLRGDSSANGLVMERVEAVLALNKWAVVPELKIKVGVFEEKQPPRSEEGQEDVEEDFIEFDADLIRSLKEPLVCRTRREGDKMWFAGVGHKALKKVFQEEKIPKDQRASLALIASGNQVLWIPGIRTSDWGKTAHPKRLYLQARKLIETII